MAKCIDFPTICPSLAHIGALVANAHDALVHQQIEYANKLLCDAQDEISTFYELKGEIPWQMTAQKNF